MVAQNSLTNQKGRIMCINVRGFLMCLLLSLITACGDEPKLKALSSNDVVLAYGDSLTYGTGVSPPQTYPAVLQSLIGIRVINAGIPGETSEEALNRLPAVLEEYHPKLVILCTGGNDMLRKLDMNALQSNLRQMIKLIQAQQAQVILIGVPTPTLFGGPPELYEKTATELSLPYEGKILNKILKDRDLKSDPIHPNEKGYRQLSETMAELLKEEGAVK
jgi:lysophospholipase L1-like esterase